jgi:hypothetical protein
VVFFRPKLVRNSRVKRQGNREVLPLKFQLVKLKQDINQESCPKKKSAMVSRYEALLECFKTTEETEQ